MATKGSPYISHHLESEDISVGFAGRGAGEILQSHIQDRVQETLFIDVNEFPPFISLSSPVLPQ